jgi:cell wall-associated NlpC family hydrolase
MTTKRLISIARSQIGKPYKFGSDINWANQEEVKNPPSFDCSSFVQWCFAQVGLNIFKESRSAILQASIPGKRILVFEIKNLQPGDLIFFDGERGYYRRDLFLGEKIDIGHVAIYVGQGKIIHADGSNGRMVVEEPLKEVCKRPNRRITYIKRYIY